MSLAIVAGRAVVEIGGADAATFLQRLLTNDVEALTPDAARYAALLTPQGKIVADMLVFRTAEGFLLDAPASAATELATRLKQYRLRAKVDVADVSDRIAAVAIEPGTPLPEGVVASAADPRHPALWARALVLRDHLPASSLEAEQSRDAARIDAGVPEGGRDFAYGDAFPHEANLDHLGGIDFGKGCYVGQEVVSRVHHRGSARKRVVPVTYDGAAPPAGTPLMAGATEVGVAGSAAGDRGLAIVRLDRLGEDRLPLAAGDRTAIVHLPPWAEPPRA